jgi:hypothetical protein
MCRVQLKKRNKIHTQHPPVIANAQIVFHKKKNIQADINSLIGTSSRTLRNAVPHTPSHTSHHTPSHASLAPTPLTPPPPTPSHTSHAYLRMDLTMLPPKDLGRG